MRTEAQAEAVRSVFLAAVREAGYDTIAYVGCHGDHWRMLWLDDVPTEVAYRALTLAKAAIGEQAPCFWCWRNAAPVCGPNPCALGDCRAPIEESA